MGRNNRSLIAMARSLPSKMRRSKMDMAQMDGYAHRQ